MHFFRSLLFFAGRRGKCMHLCGAFDDRGSERDLQSASRLCVTELVK